MAGKYRLLRYNGPNHTIGLAATLGLEIPTGDDFVSSDTFDLESGLYASFRYGRWASDVNVTYTWNGFAGNDSAGIDPGNDFECVVSIGHQFSLTPRVSITPLVEFAYGQTDFDKRSGHRLANTGERMISAAPGVKLTVSSFILEFLVRFPLSQDQHGTQLEQAPSFILGTRFML